jgi:hypothetical protein
MRVNGGSVTSDPGDYVVYLPRPFEKVTRIRLMNAAMLGVQPSDTYIMMNIEGLNRMDECASGADRSGYVDAAFAKILNDRPVVATGAAYTYSTITNVTNRVFSYNATAYGSGSVTLTPNATSTAITFGGVTGTIPVGTSIVVSGLTGNSAVYNGAYVVSTSASGTFTVQSIINVGNVGATTAAIAAIQLTGAVGNGTSITFTFNGPHNIAIGETITIAGTTGFTGANMTGVVTSIPTSTTLTLASPAVGSVSGVTSATVTVNNLQYSYVTTITTSFVTGQYLVVSGFTGANVLANTSAQILQSSLSTGTSGTFETTNISTLTANNTAGTAIISQAIYYNDMSYAPNITYYNPPIGTLDRMHITLRRHLPLGSVSVTNPVNTPITFGPAENSFTFEIEYLDNVFDDVSTFETRLDNSNYDPKLYV